MNINHTRTLNKDISIKEQKNRSKSLW